MGLDFSHGNAHWSYGGFMNFRSRLVEELGYTKPLIEMYNDNSYTCMDKEPIYPLINHSDCDGELTVEEMMQILPQLRSIIEKWDDNDMEKMRAEDLIEGMEEAIANNENIEFC